MRELLPPQQLAAPSADAWIAVAVATAALVAAFLWLPAVYRCRSSWPVYVAAVCLSWLPVQLLAWLFEGRQMWRPGQHSAVFWWGDLVALPVTAVALHRLRRMSRVDRPWADSWPWLVAAALVALLVGYIYRCWEVESMAADPLWTPAKVWHDHFVYPTFSFFLLSQAPFLWQAPWGGHRRGAVARWSAVAAMGVVCWWGLGHVYDARPAEQRPPLPLVAADTTSPVRPVWSRR